MKFEDVLEKFPDAIRGSSGWSSPCPAHDDDRPSLSIAQGSDGRTLLKCFAGCNVEDICHSIGLKTRDLFIEKLSHFGGGIQGKISEVYPYHDEQCKLIYQCVRYEPKDFRQRRPDGNGGWHWNLQGVCLVLFRLPEVLYAISRGNPIYIVEGEKDALTLSERGFCGTCNPMGAGPGKWLPSFSESLRGADCVIIPDNDTAEKKFAGQRHAAAIAESLQGIAARVRVCVLPEIWRQKSVKDISDFFDANANISDLLNFIDRGVEDYEPPVFENPIVKNVSKNEITIEMGRSVSQASELGEDCIILPGGKVTITETAINLFRRIAHRHEVFTRGKAIVSLQRSMSGGMVLEPVRPSAGRSLFERYGRFFAWRIGNHSAEVLKPCIIPEETARALLDCQAGTNLLPAVTGIVNCPIITEAVTTLKICGKGYDSATGMLILRGDVPEEIPLTEAITAINGLLEEFNFQSPGDLSRAVASFITPALRMGNLIRGFVPVDVAEADKSQSGKTYRHKMIAAIYGERPALVPLKRSGVGGVDESLFEKLVNGRPFVQFDNYRGPLDSPALESFLTAEGSFPCRIPGVREIEVDPSRFFILLTSNGVETTRDLANRSSIIRIFKREGVTFKDTLNQIIEYQSYYLGCIFAVIKEWHHQGKLRTNETGHDFREWSQVLDWIVQNIFGLAPLISGHTAAQERVSNPALTFLRQLALVVAHENMLDLPLTTSRLFEIAESAEIPVPGLRPADVHDGEKARKIIGIKLGSIFAKMNPFTLDGFVITRGQSQYKREDGNGLNPMKVYTFVTCSPATTSSSSVMRKTTSFSQSIPPVEGVEGSEPNRN